MKELHCMNYAAFIEHKPKFPEGRVVSLDEFRGSEELENELVHDYYYTNQPKHSSGMYKVDVQPNGDFLGYIEEKKIYLIRNQEVITPWFESIHRVDPLRNVDHYLGRRGDHEFLIKPFLAKTIA